MIRNGNFFCATFCYSMKIVKRRNLATGRVLHSLMIQCNLFSRDTLETKAPLMEVGLEFALYWSVKVFSMKVLIGDTNFTSLTGDGAAILRGHPSHANLHFLVKRHI